MWDAPIFTMKAAYVPLDSVDFAYTCRVCAILSLVRQYFHFFFNASGALKPGKTLLGRLDCALRREAYFALQKAIVNEGLD